MSARYKEYQQLNLPAISQEILKNWSESGAFQKSISLRDGSPSFVFYEGPPSANGMPGIHHVISRTLKDLVCRYKTMQGYQVNRKGGWDTHGLPVELGVEKELGITKEDIGKKISVEEYNRKCREVVMRFKDQWDSITQKMGYWVDLDHPYVTFENNYIETLWWILSELYKKGYLYESVSIQPYSPAAGTGLSSHELNQPGTYKDVKDTSATVIFTLRKDGNNENHPAYKKLMDALFTQSEDVTKDEGIGIMAWTTTPWTLPSNLGLTVGPNIDYVLIQSFNPYTAKTVNVILAKNLVSKYFKQEGENGNFAEYKPADKIIPWKIIANCKGSELEGLEYEQLLPFEANSIENIEEESPGAKPFRVLTAEFVTTEDGTGIVHTAPAFGADDFKVGQKNNIGILTLVDKRGRFLPGVKDGVFLYGEEYVKEDYLKEDEKKAEFEKQKEILEANGKLKDLKKYISVDDRIVLKLQEENKLFKKEKYEHTYPHCWRTDKPILYYPLDAWFIKTTAAKERMVELNKTINWKPAATGTGRFGNWLENMVDWNLSRSRFWGTPLPIWRTGDGAEEKCIGSIAELNAEIRKAAEVLGGETNKHYLHEGILDLHKPYVDEITLVSPSGKPMKRVPDLIDVWFDSGAMPYAQWHFPFENKETFEKNFPADFIAEGVDQTRGWFYTLHVLAVLLFDSVAYKTVVSNGLVLDKNGNKMSKRLGNVVDPFTTINNYGADATRWYLITNASPWDSLKFDEEGIREVQRKFFGTLYNTYQFFALYANVDGFSFREKNIPMEERPEIDRWILSALNSLVITVTNSLDAYEPTQAGRAIEEFLDSQLSNWYVRLCRRRFWKGEYEHDKVCAYQTLYECLETLSRLIAPIAPFFADWLFNNLNAVTNRFDAGSVHHTLFPEADEANINKGLEKRMQLAQDASSLILSLRKKVNIKVRQPLQKVFIPAMDSTMASDIKLVENIIKAETNIKEVEILEADNDFIRKKAKANFKTLGKKLGANMKWAAAEIEKFTNATIEKVQQGDYVLNTEKVAAGEMPIVINAEDIEIITDEIPGYEIAGKGTLTVALDISITEALQHEGNAREFVNRIQNIRKESDFQLTDRIKVTVSENAELQNSLIEFKDYICREILADSLDFVPQISNGGSTQIEVNAVSLTVNILKQS
ncbi:MAG: isoleucine--tRNA ligase [Bacteroidetes bacterium]|nr:isoleucine--tRNA ligase [Bacteroidota bacterium]